MITAAHRKEKKKGDLKHLGAGPVWNFWRRSTGWITSDLEPCFGHVLGQLCGWPECCGWSMKITQWQLIRSLKYSQLEACGYRVNVVSLFFCYEKGEYLSFMVGKKKKKNVKVHWHKFANSVGWILFPRMFFLRTSSETVHSAHCFPSKESNRVRACRHF